MDKPTEAVPQDQPTIQRPYSRSAVKSLLCGIAAVVYLAVLLYFGQSLPRFPLCFGCIYPMVFVVLAKVAYDYGKRGAQEITVSENQLDGRWMTYVGRAILVISIGLLFLAAIVGVFVTVMGYWKPEWLKQRLF